MVEPFLGLGRDGPPARGGEHHAQAAKTLQRLIVKLARRVIFTSKFIARGALLRQVWFNI